MGCGLQMINEQYIRNNNNDIILRVFRTACDKHNNMIISCLPEREYFIVASIGLNDDEVRRRLHTLIDMDLIKKIGSDKYNITSLGKSLLSKINQIKPRVINNLKNKII